MASNTVNSPARPLQAGGKDKHPRPAKPNYKHIHRFPLPVAVHPLPPLIPHNPLSVISVLLSYLTTYLVSPPKKEIYSAYFDASTSSIQVTDPKTMRALWEMGFFGRGNLSRSEPSWLEREKKRRGLLATKTNEEVTGQRRVERREMKLERARKEQEAIAQQLKEEAARLQAGASRSSDQLATSAGEHMNGFPNGSADRLALASEVVTVEEHTNGPSNGSVEKITVSSGETSSTTKTVRFSPVVEEKKFTPEPQESIYDSTKLAENVLINEEHLQLTHEEALFLVYGLGALQVFDQDTNTIIPTPSLIKLFTQNSTFPARSDTEPISPDDPFLISYVAYHHFRSLGWVVRSGVKFGTDYLLYNRGPVFAHAEFAVLVLPSYENPYWESTPELREYSTKKQSRSWWWLHGVNRVQAQVKKTLVLCFVDVPPPLPSSWENLGGILRQYKVREILLRRWLPNRSRD
ncbi:tRNA-splicing endonuclease subunit Sen2, putative [Talaromyces stipitatus ATCC 10500]|uniref:tRNA-splicing endonuclease subunit Sen2 n=1 Tax=Talaromyces stipitatus (strain ATCC 10500 / CBS 375.48 / QM 6759 / NRRL 1006) TaxID=441959 RepID=B8M9R2_TALSN|nr:tRNA-splicing endonuclease subunit Sen2, putative [Talaromyces stipitatus ATCC 10500]EED18064.1 tRNA-splicing endonuclease subunit Sen2, putative [Talaromyces stipitatus ATCC 10500]